MKIAIIGIRGIPVIYSGFESFVENLAPTLVKNNFIVCVYCRSAYVNFGRKHYKKVKLISIPTVKSKNLESFIHSFLSTIHALIFVRPKIIYYLGVGNALFTFIPRLFGIKTVINVDGLDWKREKWGKIASFYLRISQYLATILPNITITDSLYMKDYYLSHYGKKTIYIPYGFDEKLLMLGKDIEDRILKKYNIKKKKYFVWVGRIVPDNHLEELIYAFKQLKTDYKCVIIGDDLYKSGYKNFIFNLVKNDKRIVFTGFISKDKYALLVRNAFCYVETKRSGGAHPSLIEATGLANFIVSNDYLANKQLLKNSHRYYKLYKWDKSRLDLFKCLNECLKSKNNQQIKKIKKRYIISEFFRLDRIFDKYIWLFNHTV